MSKTARVSKSIIGIATALCIASAMSACGGEGDDSNAAGGGANGGDSDPIMFGVAAAKTGFLKSYDVEETNALMLGIDEINEQGGILGRKVEVQWIDTKSDLATGATAARELIEKGADVIVTSCDADYGAPQAIEANRAGIVAISYCAGGIQYADAKTLGKHVFTLGVGADDWGTASAEWAYNTQGWRKAYIIADDSVEFHKTVVRYYKARWKELGGEIVGEDKTVSLKNQDISSQITRMRGPVANADFIVLDWFVPVVGQAIRQIRAAGIKTPIQAPASDAYGPSIADVAGPVSDYFPGAWGCMIDCTGEDNPGIDAFLAAYREKHGEPEIGAHALLGRDIATLMKTAIEEAGTTDGDALTETLETMPPVPLLTGPAKYSATCHKPIARDLPILEYEKGEATVSARVKPESVPDIGDGNPCR